MELNKIEQTDKIFMQTKVQMEHVEGHFDIDIKTVEDVVTEWSVQVGTLDLTNVSVFKIELTFFGKFNKEYYDK